MPGWKKNAQDLLKTCPHNRAAQLASFSKETGQGLLLCVPLFEDKSISAGLFIIFFYCHYLFIYFYFFVFLPFLGQFLRHMEVPRLGIEWEL